MSEPYEWTCALQECGKEARTQRHKPPAGWVWCHYYSIVLRAPTSLLGCCEEHARRAAKKFGRVTKIEVVHDG